MARAAPEGAILRPPAGADTPAGRMMNPNHIEETQAMWNAFNATMRVVSTLIGAFMLMIGIVWMLQGLNLAFRVGFMVGQPKWTVFGALMALAGIGQVVWSNTRQRRP